MGREKGDKNEQEEKLEKHIKAFLVSEVGAMNQEGRAGLDFRDV